MIYSPAHYREERSDLIFEVMRRFEFATVVTIASNEPFVSHLPLILDASGNTLIGHCARANPQWRHFVDNGLVTVIFNGPHAYISPAWYQPKPDNVPTWNYVAVHVRAKAHIVDDVEESYSIMKTMVDHFEAKYKTGWSLPDEKSDELMSLLKGIVSFRLEIESVQGKFKLSQKQDGVSRENIIGKLPDYMGFEGAEVAEYMRMTR